MSPCSNYSIFNSKLSFLPSEREWNYDLNFQVWNTSNHVVLPKITGFKQLTVCWWMNAFTYKYWSTVFSLVSATSQKILAFSYQVSGLYRLVLNGEER